VRAKLTDFGLLGVRPADLTHTASMTAVEYRFDPVWHLVLARLLFGPEGPPPGPDAGWAGGLAAKLGTVLGDDHREGVGEFALALLLAELKRRHADAPAAAAEFAVHPGLPGAAAFRAACYEDPAFQSPFARACRKRLKDKLKKEPTESESRLL